MRILLRLAPGLLLGVFLFAQAARAHPLTESQIFVRCYSQLVRALPSRNDALLGAVKGGQMKAVDACMRLLNEASLKENGSFAGSLAKDARGLAILKTLQSFHMSWFPHRDFVREESEDGTALLFDSNEMGYHLTYNLLAPNRPFSEIVTRPNSFRGRRLRETPVQYANDPSSGGPYKKISDFRWFSGESAQKEWHPKLVDFGLLIGVEPMAPDENPIELANPLGQRAKVYATESLGGGLLGTIPYILLNTTQAANMTSNDGLRMHRSWSQSVFADLLCRDLPLLREEDVRNMVQAQSPLPFRHKSTCMQCHASMDPLARTIANVEEMYTTKLGDTYFLSRALLPFRADLPPLAGGSGAEDQNFYRRPVQGRLFYRSYDGQLVNQEVKSVAELGEAMKDKNDIYVCAAKRYFEFFTGISLNLAEGTVSAQGRAAGYRDFIIGQGLELKKGQSLKTLVRNILNSKYYAQSDYGAFQ